MIFRSLTVEMRDHYLEVHTIKKSLLERRRPIPWAFQERNGSLGGMGEGEKVVSTFRNERCLVILWR